MNNPQREKVMHRFNKLFITNGAHPDRATVLSTNIERGVFNHTIYTYKDCGYTDHKWNDAFFRIYIGKAVSIYNNLNPDSSVKNPALIKRLMSGEIKAKDVCFMSSSDMYPELYKDIAVDYSSCMTPTVQFDENEEGLLKCGKCKTYKTSYYQMQCRGGDEAISTFASCLNCGHKWKFN